MYEHALFARSIQKEKLTRWPWTISTAGVMRFAYFHCVSDSGTLTQLVFSIMPKFTDSVDATSYTKWSNVDKSICEAKEGYFCLRFSCMPTEQEESKTWQKFQTPPHLQMKLDWKLYNKIIDPVWYNQTKNMHQWHHKIQKDAKRTR